MNSYLMMLCKLWIQDLKTYLNIMKTYPKKSFTYAFNQLYFYWSCLKLEIILTGLEYFKTIRRRK